jgi:hypothetical protein
MFLRKGSALPEYIFDGLPAGVILDYCIDEVRDKHPHQLTGRIVPISECISIDRERNHACDCNRRQFCARNPFEIGIDSLVLWFVIDRVQSLSHCVPVKKLDGLVGSYLTPFRTFVSFYSFHTRLWYDHTATNALGQFQDLRMSESAFQDGAERQLLEQIAMHVVNVPGVFTITPVDPNRFDPRNIWSEPIRITLWCTHPDECHPVPEASYDTLQPKEWFIQVLPYLRTTLKFLKLMPAAREVVAHFDASEIASHIQIFESVCKSAEQALADIDDIHVGRDNRALPRRDDVESPADRAIRKLLLKLGDTNFFKPLHKVLTPAGRVAWVCPAHFSTNYFERGVYVAEHKRTMTISDVRTIASTEQSGSHKGSRYAHAFTINELDPDVNFCRFIPNLNVDNERKLFLGAQYFVQAIDTGHDFIPGIAIGPRQLMRNKPRASITDGGIVIPVRANPAKSDSPDPDYDGPCIWVREAQYLDSSGTPQVAYFADSVSFSPDGPHKIIATVPSEEDSTAYFEILTGEIHSEGRADQLIQQGWFRHGSVKWAGGTFIVEARSTKHYNGALYWKAQLYRVRYSSKDSEVILVRQLNRFYLLYVNRDGQPSYFSGRAEEYETEFDRRCVD